MSKSRNGKGGVIVPHPTEPGVLMVPLTNGGFALVDEADRPLVEEKTWRRRDDIVNSYPTSYAAWTVQVSSKKYATHLMHRVILGLKNGDPRFGDHKNHDGLDNRRSNLRIANYRESIANTRKRGDSTSPFKGVFRRKAGDWGAKIFASFGPAGKSLNIPLGCYDTAEEAAFAYAAASRLKEEAAFAFLEEIPRDKLPSPERQVEIAEFVLTRFSDVKSGRGVRWTKTRPESLSRKGEENGCAKLDDDKVREIRRRLARGEPQVGIAEEFGVDKTAINKIAKRRSWKHVSE